MSKASDVQRQTVEMNAGKGNRGYVSRRERPSTDRNMRNT